MKVSLDNGTTWLTATAAAGATTFSLAGVTLTASGTLLARVENSAGAVSTPLAQAYVLDQVAPAAPAAPDLLVASDIGVSNTDNITNVINPTFTGTAEAGSTITLFDGTTQVGTGIATVNGDWFATTSTLANGIHSITAKATDVAGNVSAASAALSVTIDTVAPAAPSAPDLTAASDTGVSSTDNITNVDHADLHRHRRGRQHGDPATTARPRSAPPSPRPPGSGAITASTPWRLQSTASPPRRRMRPATSAPHRQPCRSPSTPRSRRPRSPDLVAASDKGVSSTDNITNVTTPVSPARPRPAAR